MLIVSAIPVDAQTTPSATVGTVLYQTVPNRMELHTEQYGTVQSVRFHIELQTLPQCISRRSKATLLVWAQHGPRCCKTSKCWREKGRMRQQVKHYLSDGNVGPLKEVDWASMLNSSAIPVDAMYRCQLYRSNKRKKRGEDAAQGHHSWEEWKAACALQSTTGHEIKKETTTPTFSEGTPS